MRWVYLVLAPDQLTAEVWRDLLIASGVPAMVSPADTWSFLGVSSLPCRLLVPEDRLEDAQLILSEHLPGEP